MKPGDKVRYKRKRTSARTIWTIVKIDEADGTCRLRGPAGVKDNVKLADLELVPE